MASRNEEVMEMVRRELEQQPGVASRELYERAREMDPEIGNMSVQQFHARYPLQLQRGRGGGGGGGGTRSRKSTGRGKTASRAKGAAAARTAAGAKTGAGAGRGQGQQRRRRRGAEAQAQNRDAVRSVLLRFASDFSQAESRPEIVGVLSNVDTYVNEVMQVLER